MFPINPEREEKRQVDDEETPDLWTAAALTDVRRSSCCSAAAAIWPKELNNESGCCRRALPLTPHMNHRMCGGTDRWRTSKDLTCRRVDIKTAALRIKTEEEPHLLYL